MTSDSSLQHLLEAGVRQHQAGNLADAEQLYHQALEQDPSQPDALNLLGVIAEQRGDLEQALALFDRAITAAPKLAIIPFNKGNALRDAGRAQEAQAAYEAALACDPGFHDALLNLGVLLQEEGQTKLALEHFNTLIRLNPNHHQAHYNIGKCFQARGNIDNAFSAFETALTLNPNDHDAHFAIANVCSDMARYNDAIDHIKTAIKLKPNWSEAFGALGIFLLRAGQYQDAITACQNAIDFDPDKSTLKIALGIAHLAAGDEQNATNALSLATKNADTTAEDFIRFADIASGALGPQQAIKILELSYSLERTATALSHIGVALQNMDLHSMAGPYYEAAMTLEPDDSRASTALGFLKLFLGQLDDGWPHLNARLSDESVFKSRRGKTEFWLGQDPSTKTILVFFTDGLGEHIIQSAFVRYIADQTEHCIVECSRRLVPILQRSFPDVEFVSGYDRTGANDALERADYQVPALNMARHVRPKIETTSLGNGSLLKADPELVRAYREKYEKQADGRKLVGLSWISGNTKIGKYKTLELNALKPLLDTEAMCFVNLQYGVATSVIDEFSKETGIEIYTDPTVDQLSDLEHFFAQVAALDLVITISNSAAHVAGSLGVPTWIILPRQGIGPLWFWFLDREDSPWYPSVQLFRQKSTPLPGQDWWPEVIDEVAGALSDWLAKPLASRPDP